ncbi:hypothetical protein BCAH1134_C0395 (plasmid) [Bacillus cereus AH1134]|nr:hypothetical protein BCAH1134_C0395 [Bacillus cereus AH1134]
MIYPSFTVALKYYLIKFVLVTLINEQKLRASSKKFNRNTLLIF